MKRKKKKNHRKNKQKEKLENLQNKIRDNRENIKDPRNSDFLIKNSNSWFDICSTDDKNLFDSSIEIEQDKLECDGYSTSKINVYPNYNQKRILLKWMDCYVLMYNQVTKYFKECRFNNTKCEFSIGKLKNMFKNDKESIMKWSEISIKEGKKERTIKTDSHLLDYAINDSVNRLRTNITNLKNGTIRYFRLRYLKMSKNNRILKMEKLAFKENGFWVRSLGKVMKTDNDNFNYLSNIHTTAILRYQKKSDKFVLLFKHPKKDMSDDIKYANKKDIISIDPGIRRFMTGYTNNGVVKIGDTCYKKIKRLIKNIDKIRANDEIKEKNRKINRIDNKIKNMITDMQWKVIKYLTDNYKTVLMGNFSTKNIRKDKKIPKIVARVGKKYNFFQFKERLKYKCIYTNTSYKHVDEAFTSKCCHSCGFCDRTLEGEKIYKCKKCNIKIDRDIKGAMNILMVSCN